MNILIRGRRSVLVSITIRVRNIHKGVLGSLSVDSFLYSSEVLKAGHVSNSIKVRLNSRIREVRIINSVP